MKIIPPSVEILDTIDPARLMQSLESYGRVCYKSEEKASADSSGQFIRRLIRSGHESVIEHEKLSVRFICDRGVTHQLVRHRIASYSQESTRYCNYSKGRFGGELTFIKPCFWEEGSEAYKMWLQQMQSAEDCYLALLAQKATPEEARSVLPNSIKTEIITTMNLRAWRHFLKLRCAKDAHPQIREVSLMLLDMMKELLPDIFFDL